MSIFSIKMVYLIGGWICIGLAVLGVFLPILPTTPLVLLAAFLFSKSSDKLHRWLLANRLFGKIILDWQESGVIRMRAKIASTAIIVPLFAYTLGFVNVHLIVKLLIAPIGLWVLWFIWSRPSAPNRTESPEQPDLATTSSTATGGD